MKKFISPAKINLGLWVLGKRPDGYHEILTYFHTIELADYISISKAPKLIIETTNPEIPTNEENIVYKALKKFEEWTGIEPNYKVFIEKNIPVGAGLGGGSSNAATVLKAINEIEGNPLTEEELFKLASTVGADVPFFLKGGFAKAEGIGEKLTFLDKTFEEKIFIIYPQVSISTKEIYQALTEKDLTKKEEIPIIDSLLEDFNLLLDRIENKLKTVVQEKYPVVKEVINTLEYLGYKPFLSGSGSAVFAVGTPSEKVKLVCKTKGWRLIETTLK
ncbi:MAG: 4-(cytidine 5'-diphospho)-2-C-methyl-D-erythritol kinase [Aquificae bacterium]|nr:4-(cytidine 5'-diphospho)-2-C-methyl-D-erythritol kinase [Aquificota bacterium]